MVKIGWGAITELESNRPLFKWDVVLGKFG